MGETGVVGLLDEKAAGGVEVGETEGCVLPSLLRGFKVAERQNIYISTFPNTATCRVGRVGGPHETGETKDDVRGNSHALAH